MNRFRPSYWESQTFLATYDIAIIGSGIVGLNAAISLKQRNPQLNVVVLERGFYPIGASTRNAGFACFGSISEVKSDIDHLGYDAALQLFVKRKKGLERLFQIVEPKEVDYQHLGGAEIFLDGEGDVYSECLEELDRLNADLQDEFGGDVFALRDDLIKANGLTNVRHLIAHPMEGQLHPGKLVLALQRRASSLGVSCVNGFDVVSIEEEQTFCRINSELQSVEARYVLIASNGFAGQLVDSLEVQPARNQVLVTEPISGLRLKGCFHYNQGYVYFRNIDNRILIGGARHIALEHEMTSEFGLTDEITGWLNSFLKRHLNVEEFGIEYAWSGIMGVGPVKEPIIRMTSTRIGVAVRLGGMGVAIGSLVGDQAAELLESMI